MKTCSICKKEKPLNEFHKNSYKKSGYRSQCKECRKLESSKKAKSEYNKKYYRENLEKESIRRKKYRDVNREKINKRAVERYHETKEDRIKYAKEYRNKNRVLTNERTIKWRHNNPDKVKAYGKRYREENRESVNKNFREYISNRNENDSNFRIKNSIRHRFRSEIKRRKYTHTSWSSLFNITGFKYSDYVDFFEKHQPGFLEKYKTTVAYHIDHIIPVAIYDFRNENHIKKCWNPRNLRIITVDENQAKKDKLDFMLIKKYGIKDLLPEGIKCD